MATRTCPYCSVFSQYSVLTVQWLGSITCLSGVLVKFPLVPKGHRLCNIDEKRNTSFEFYFGSVSAKVSSPFLNNKHLCLPRISLNGINKSTLTGQTSIHLTRHYNEVINAPKHQFISVGFSDPNSASFVKPCYQNLKGF